MILKAVRRKHASRAALDVAEMSTLYLHSMALCLERTDTMLVGVTVRGG